MKPVIGILLDYDERKTAQGGYSDRPWYALRVNYAQAIVNNGGIPILLPYINQDIDSYLAMCDGLLLPGGDYDINPERYGEKLNPHTNPSSGVREVFEEKLISKAMSLSMPILAICAGEQLLNVMFGGTLIQYIPDVVKGESIHRHKGDQSADCHDISIVKDTLLHRIVGVSSCKVNSHHRQAVGKLGKDLVVSAVAPDGIVECIEHQYLPFCLGVEWHPEYCNNEHDVKIINAFVKASSSFHSLR
jgi:putative glutamine amidotransferase